VVSDRREIAREDEDVARGRLRQVAVEVGEGDETHECRLAYEQSTNTENGPWRRDGLRAGSLFVLRLTPSARPKRRSNLSSPAM
jgi:hypothetical protein